MSARTPADPASAFADLWERDNADAEAMLMAVGAVDLWRVVLVACDCAETALRYVPAGADGPRIAIETARAWSRGEATMEDVRVAAAAAWPAAPSAAADASADARLAYAVRAYARAADAAADGRFADAARFVARANAARGDARAAAFAARAAARAAAYAASTVFADAPSALAACAADSAASAASAVVAFDDWLAVRASSLRSMAALVRRHIPLDVIGER